MSHTGAPARLSAAPPLRSDAREGDVRWAFSGRATGNCSLLVGDGDRPGARARLLRLVGAAPSHAVFMQQVHGGRVRVVGRGERGRGVDDQAGAVPQTDALVTFDPGVALVVLVADCVPVLLAAPGHGVAAVHAGRAGVLAGVVPAAVRVLGGDEPGQVRAVVGPAIGGCCYEVPAELAATVVARVPAARATTSRGSTGLDLPAAVRAQLAAAGVTEVRQVGSCTRCDPDRWFSHRASGAEADRWPPGRQAGVIVRDAAPPAAHVQDGSLDSEP